MKFPPLLLLSKVGEMGYWDTQLSQSKQVTSDEGSGTSRHVEGYFAGHILRIRTVLGQRAMSAITDECGVLLLFPQTLSKQLVFMLRGPRNHHRHKHYSYS